MCNKNTIPYQNRIQYALCGAAVGGHQWLLGYCLWYVQRQIKRDGKNPHSTILYVQQCCWDPSVGAGIISVRVIIISGLHTLNGQNYVDNFTFITPIICVCWTLHSKLALYGTGLSSAALTASTPLEKHSTRFWNLTVRNCPDSNTRALVRLVNDVDLEGLLLSQSWN